MAGDISYGGGGGGGGYYPPSFDPNNPMGGGGGGYNPAPPPLTPTQSYVIDTYSTVQHMDNTTYTSDFFNSNLNSENPYQQYAIISAARAPGATHVGSYAMNLILQSGNNYEIVGWTHVDTPEGGANYPVYKVYNNAYSEYETSATSAQQSYYDSNTIEYAKQVSTAEKDFIESYGNIRNSDIRSDIQRLADYKSELSTLQFQDDITDYLNRVTDTDNSERIAELEKIISDLENKISQDMLHQARVDEAQRQKDREWFNWDFNYLTDPYFGRSPVLMYSRSPMDGVQQSPANFLNMSMSGELHDWFAGGALYDSPRAGDILFNPIGNLNTTVFLGLENRNFTPDLQAVYAGAEVFRTFGRLAGDSGFSVLDFGS